jgi:prolipoprotein diacylglyceryltransferase
MDLVLPPLYPLYAIPVLVALLVGLLFPVARHITDRSLRRQYYFLQFVTFLSAILGAKLVFLVGEYRWPFVGLESWHQVFDSGRSLVGALIFGLLGAELAKLVIHYPLPPNDRFAALLPFPIAIGRIGCWLQGCCRGVPCDYAWAVTYSDGVARHPAPVYEMIFHVSAGLVAVWLVRTKRLRGCVFSLYLIAYGVFRFFSEFIRETPKTFAALSSYQWLSLVMIGLGTGFLLKRSLFPPEIWSENVSIGTLPQRDGR